MLKKLKSAATHNSLIVDSTIGDHDFLALEADSWMNDVLKFKKKKNF